ncbi:zwei Ig domain protein zig-8-like isoform X1, partial [Vespula squamosa]
MKISHYFVEYYQIVVHFFKLLRNLTYGFNLFVVYASITTTSSYIKILNTQPVTEITGGPDLFINKDSTINLTCLVRYAPEPPSTIIWSHNRQAINFDSPRGGISLITEKGPVTSSRLLIQKAIQEDSGLYTCSPNNTHPNSVRVHIVNEFDGRSKNATKLKLS